jgi:transposase
LALLDLIPAIGRPQSLVADRAYDSDKHRQLLRERQIEPLLARRQTPHGSGLGHERWVIERTFAWLHNKRRLLIRTDRRADIHESFLALACCLICWRRLQPSLS